LLEHCFSVLDDGFEDNIIEDPSKAWAFSFRNWQGDSGWRVVQAGVLFGAGAEFVTGPDRALHCHRLSGSWLVHCNRSNSFDP